MSVVPVQQDIDFYQHITAAGPGMIAIIQAEDLKIVFVNNVFEQELGYSNNEVKEGNTFFTELLDSYQLDRLKYHIASVKDDYTKITGYTIYKLRGRGKELASFHLFIAPVTDGAGSYNNLYKILIQPDLSQWTLPFTSFETRELFLEHFKSEDSGTFEWLISVDKAFWSEGVYRIYDTPYDTVIDRTLATSFVHPADKEWVTDATDKMLADGGTLDIQFRIVTAKGAVKTVHTLARLAKDKEGVPVKFIGSLRDISKQRDIEEELKSKVEKLFHSNRELEEFAYVASHDMQEPLRKITTFSSRLMEKYKDVLTGDGALYLSRMTVSAENMRLLINDLLEFSRISNAQLPIETVDLNLLVRQVKTDLDLVVEETNAELKVGKLPDIEAIHSQMKQLFTNIISNAIKFRRADVPPVITIEASDVDVATKVKYELPVDQQYYQIVVADNGIGFEAEYAIRIFNIFQRLHGKSEYPGSGIGLAICKKIVQHHHGTIYAEGTPGVGSRFIIVIPQKQKNNRTA